MQLYRERGGPFAHIRPHRLPRFRSPRLEASFWFYACMPQRAANHEEGVINGLGRLFVAQPDLFKPELAQHLDPALVTRRLKRFGLGYKAVEIGWGWVVNAQRLHRLWDDDPFNLVADYPGPDVAYARICHRKDRGMFGFQEKLASLFVHYLIQAGRLQPFFFPGPVEWHVLRIVFANELITLTDDRLAINSKVVIPAVRLLLFDYCQQHHVQPVDLHNALWRLSRNWCEQHPGNRLLIDGVKDGLRTRYYEPPYEWNDWQVSVYERTCGQCPLEATCRRCVPRAPYDVSGLIDTERRRDKPTGC